MKKLLVTFDKHRECRSDPFPACGAVMTGLLVTFDCFTPTNLAIKSNWSWRVIYDVITLRDNKWCIELFSPICPLILPLPQALYWQSGLIDSCGVVYFYWQRIINSTAKHPNLHLRSHVGKNTDWPSSYYTTIILSWSLTSSLLKTSALSGRPLLSVSKQNSCCFQNVVLWFEG